MGVMNAADIAKRWQSGMSQSTEKIRQGIQAVTEAPTAKAARATDRMLAGVQRAIAEGRTQAALNAVTLEDWKRAALDKGVARVAAGAATSVGKMQDFMQDFIPHLEAGQRELSSMPRGDLEANIARATAMMRHNSKFRRSR